MKKAIPQFRTWDAYPNEYVPLPVLAQRWSVTTHALRKWIREDALPSVKIGGRVVRVPRGAAIAFEGTFHVQQTRNTV